MDLDNGGREQPYLPFHKRIGQFFDNFKENHSPIISIDPKKLHTSNRYDIDYRIGFLKSIENNTPFTNTLYYQFVSDPDRNLPVDAESLCKNFQKLYFDIKLNSITEPSIIGYYNSKFLKTRYILNGKKFWKKYINKTNNYQIMDGAHRLAIALFLDFDTIPVKVFHPLGFEIPNYTDYIKMKESEYRKKLSDNMID